jgi:NAD(P)-dependent dehydrogenase (short-subunit alcohol dehydrogenase family)
VPDPEPPVPPAPPGGRRLAGSTVLVVGASRGLGRAVALACAAEGAHLVLVARTQGALEELDDAIRARAAGAEDVPGATLITLDLGDGKLVDALGAALFQRFGRLDGLVVCAAELGVLTPLAHLDPALFARLMAVNVLAPQRLIRTLDPLLRAAPAGRAVFATCEPGRHPHAYWGGYAAAKAALEMLVRVYAAELRITNAKVNLVDPGPMETALRRRAFPGEVAGKQPQPATLAPAIVELLTPDCQLNGELVSF